jgi:hypothetical protein
VEYNALILPLEKIMVRKSAIIISILILSTLILSACNLPERQVAQDSTAVPPTAAEPQPSTTPESACANPYFPSAAGNRWTYAGSNSYTGNYTRTDTVSQSNGSSFTVDSMAGDVPYSVTYSCSAAGLVASDPVTQYAGALLSSTNAPVTVNLTSNSGTTLPADIQPGDTWQQMADFEASSQDLNISGRFVFDYTAVGFDTVSVPFGTFNALRVDATIHIEVSAFHVSAGTYTTSTWMVQDIGVVKSQGASHVSGIDFSDGMQLTGFAPAP